MSGSEVYIKELIVVELHSPPSFVVFDAFNVVSVKLLIFLLNYKLLMHILQDSFSVAWIFEAFPLFFPPA